LEGEDESGRRVQGRPAVAQGPSPILLIDSPTEQRLVELGKFRRLGTVQHHTLQVSDHGLIPSGRQTAPTLDIQDRSDWSEVDWHLYQGWPVFPPVSGPPLPSRSGIRRNRPENPLRHKPVGNAFCGVPGTGCA
jgi:hypothetical protein